MSEAKSARINLRLSPESLETVRAAASVQQQDLTSFVPGAAMERARAVLAEDRILRLTPHEVNQLERAPDSEPEVVPSSGLSSDGSAWTARLSREAPTRSSRGLSIVAWMPGRARYPLRGARTARL
jgi:uncharacterized protein (DUF1778 family)